MNCVSNPKRLAAIALVVALLLPAASALAAPAGPDSPLAWATLTVQKLVGWVVSQWGVAPVGPWHAADGADVDLDGRPGEEKSPTPGHGGPMSSSSTVCGDVGPGMDPDGHCSS